MSKIPPNAAPSCRGPDVIQIDIANRQRLMKLDRPRLRRAARVVLAEHGVLQAEISIAVVDDAAIHELNRRWLRHDYATDVLSFVLEQRDGYLEGEVIASAETALRCAGELGAAAEDELLLYVVHGLLHMAGYDDQTKEAARQMRAQERKMLARLATKQPRTAPSRTANKTTAAAKAQATNRPSVAKLKRQPVPRGPKVRK